MEKQTRAIRFLIVEHDPEIRAQLEKIIVDGRLGESISASTILEAVNALDHADLDVVVCSWDQPGQATGLSLLKLVRGEDRFKHVGFVLLSSPSDEEPKKVKSARASRVDGYLLKPVDEAALTGLLIEVASKVPDRS